MDTLGDSGDDGLLVANGHRGRVIGPGPRRGLRAGEKRLTIGGEGKTMVQSRILEQGFRAVDAAVLSEGVDGDTAGCLEDQHMAKRVERDRPRLPEPADDLRHLPSRSKRGGISGCWDARATARKRKRRHILGVSWTMLVS